VQAGDNEYYIHRMLDDSYNSAGSIFMDYRNSWDFSDLNTVIYGHNMKNDSMFGTLSEYRKQNYYDGHPVLWLLTEDMNYRVELIAGFVTPSDSESYNIFSETVELQKYLRRAVDKSDFTTDIDIGTVERIITLSTCSYEYDSARYIVIGKLVPLASDARGTEIEN
jgi:sortase B